MLTHSCECFIPKRKKKVLFKADHQKFFRPKLIILQKCSWCWLRWPEDISTPEDHEELKVGLRLTEPTTGWHIGGAKQQAN